MHKASNTDLIYHKCHVLPCLSFFSLGVWKREVVERLGGLCCTVTAVLPSGRRFEEDTWDQRTWTMSWGVTLNWDEPLFIFPPPHALLLLFFPISLRTPAYFLFTTWSFPPSYPPNLLTCYLSPLSHFLPKIFPSGHHKANANIPPVRVWLI